MGKGITPSRRTGRRGLQRHDAPIQKDFLVRFSFSRPLSASPLTQVVESKTKSWQEEDRSECHPDRVPFAQYDLLFLSLSFPFLTWALPDIHMPNQGGLEAKQDSELLTQRKLNLTDLLARLQHHNTSMRRRRFLFFDHAPWLSDHSPDHQRDWKVFGSW